MSQAYAAFVKFRTSSALYLPSPLRFAMDAHARRKFGELVSVRSLYAHGLTPRPLSSRRVLCGTGF